MKEIKKKLKKNVVFSINSTKFYNRDYCSVCLKDESGNVLASKKVSISIAGKTYSVVTDKKGFSKS